MPIPLIPMTGCRALARTLLLAVTAALAAPAQADTTVDLTNKMPSVADVKAGLFPDDSCEELKAQGFKCMGFKPPVRFSLPAASFRLGSAELPEGIKRQLDVFARALAGKSGSSRTIRVEGHADASGSAEANLALSRRRAEAARDYLVAQGVAPDLIKPVGVGSEELIDSKAPLSPKNRRVVIGRDQSPASPDAAANPALPQ